MDFEKVKKYLPYVWCGLPLIAAIITLIFGLVDKYAPVKVMLIISTILLVVLAGLIYAYFFVLAERRKNYFLTDRETGQNMRRSQLAFEDVNDRMNYFMAKRVSSEGELWTGGFLGKRGMFGVDDVFKPLAVYKMLFDLGVRRNRENLQFFFDMPDADFARMINCLDLVDDINMSRKLTSIRRINDGTQTDRLADFLSGNQKYIQGRMMAYVTAHIDDFDEPKSIK